AYAEMQTGSQRVRMGARNSTWSMTESSTGRAGRTDQPDAPAREGNALAGASGWCRFTTFADFFLRPSRLERGDGDVQAVGPEVLVERADLAVLLHPGEEAGGVPPPHLPRGNSGWPPGPPRP